MCLVSLTAAMQAFVSQSPGPQSCIVCTFYLVCAVNAACLLTFSLYVNVTVDVADIKQVFFPLIIVITTLYVILHVNFKVLLQV